MNFNGGAFNLLPPMTAEDYQWLAERFKPEEEYYKVYSDPPVLPPKGVLLLLREPMSAQIKIVFNSGEFLNVQHSKRINFELTQIGLPPEKIEKALDMVWNFGKVYVKTHKPDLDSPPLVSRD